MPAAEPNEQWRGVVKMRYAVAAMNKKLISIIHTIVTIAIQHKCTAVQLSNTWTHFIHQLRITVGAEVGFESGARGLLSFRYSPMLVETGQGSRQQEFGVFASHHPLALSLSCSVGVIHAVATLKKYKVWHR